jgi:hypothetical protein
MPSARQLSPAQRRGPTHPDENPFFNPHGNPRGEPNPYRLPNVYAPLYFDDGRIYDVLLFQVIAGDVNASTSRAVHRFCNFEVLQRDVEFSHLFFYFRFYPGIFERGEFNDNEEDIYLFIRVWVYRYLEAHREPLPLSRQAEPIVVECG